MLREQEEPHRQAVVPSSLLRPLCSNPPKHGAAIVAIILSDPELFAQWKASCFVLLRFTYAFEMMLVS